MTGRPRSAARRFGGMKAKKSGDLFEQELQRSFGAYLAAKIAQLAKMPVPMRPTGLRHPKYHWPLWAPAGKSPFDIYGWMLDGSALFVGAEAKSTSKEETSIPIVPEDRSSSGGGIQSHQLASLDELARSGGIARIIWKNGQHVGVIGNEAIMNAAAIHAQASRSTKAPRGSKSIKWEEFEVLTYSQVGNRITLDWLGAGSSKTDECRQNIV